MKTPKHLIHIGYPKAGSSFLRAWFAQHPKLLYQDGGLAGFSDIYELVRAGASKEGNKYDYFVTSSEAIAVANVFAGIPNTNFGFKNQKFNQEGDTHKLCMTLHGLFPESKILFITRGFEAFAKSSYSEYIRSGGIHSKQELLGVNKRKAEKPNALLQGNRTTFMEVLHQFLANPDSYKNKALPPEYTKYLGFVRALITEKEAVKNGYTVEKFIEDLPKIELSVRDKYGKIESHSLQHLSLGQKNILQTLKKERKNNFSYDSIIHLYRQQFGKENVLIMPYELLKDNQKRFLQILQERLYIEPVNIEIGVINKSLSPQDLYWRRWLSRSISRFSSIFNERIFRVFYKKYVELLQLGRLTIFFSLLKYLAPNRKIEAFHLPENYLKSHRGEASLLKDNPLYQPYLKEYLLDD